MSIAFERSSDNRIERPGLRHGLSCGSVYDSPEPGRSVGAIFAGDRRLTAGAKKVVQERDEEVDSSSSSSIGRNSDSSGGVSDGDGDCRDGEVQSSYKGPLDCLESLEDVLPMKKGMSKFYNGKSKSFTSLADAVSCSSIKEIVKPENAYTRKRKNLLAHAIIWDKNCNFPPRNNSGSISKRPANSNRSTCTMSSNESNNSDSSNSIVSSPILSRPPRHPQSTQSRRLPNDESSSSPPQRNFSPWRSFSLSDLQCAAATTTVSASLINKGEEDNPQ